MARGCPADLLLTGKVTVRSGPMTLRAKRLEVRMDAKGQPVSARASGGVALVLREGRGRADRARLLLGQWRLELEGDAQLTRRDLGLRVAGKRVSVDLQTGSVSVAQASAQLGPRAKGR